MSTQDPRLIPAPRSTGSLERDAIPLAQILDSLPQAVFWKGLDGAYLGCNRMFAEAAGLQDPDQVRGLTDADLPWSLQEREAYLADDQEVMTHNRAKLNIVEPFSGAAGRPAWVSTTKVPLLDPERRVCGVLGYFEDITERKQVAEELKESEIRLRFALEGANDGLWDVRMQTHAVYLSPRGCEILGYGAEEQDLIASVWQDLVHPDDLGLTQERLETHLKGLAPIFEVEQRLRMKDGTWKWVLARGKVVERDGQGRPLRMTGTHTDITERRRAEHEHRELSAQLHQSQKLESLGSLAGGVAHDINNVLAAILSLASVHRDTLETGHPLARSLDTITRACLRGRDVVKSLLYFARKDLEVRGPVSLNDITREMIRLLDRTTLKRVELHADLQEPLPPIMGDAGALSHSLMNLCLNAMDAMPQGGVIQIRTCALPDGKLRLSVRDAGEGMSPEVLKQAVEPFFTTKAVGKGTGLGLAMVYGTVKAHGGALQIQSVVGEGTEVCLTFPPLVEETPGPSRPAVPETPAHAPLRILLVDDDELIRQSIAPMLERCGHRVDCAESGLEALDRIKTGLEVDLAILDLNMPGLSGAQTLPRLHALRPGLPVLLSSGHSDSALPQLLQDAPRVAFLRKPFTLAELKAKIEAMSIAPPGGRG